jgi:hypothetical protein
MPKSHMHVCVWLFGYDVFVASQLNVARIHERSQGLASMDGNGRMVRASLPAHACMWRITRASHG